MNCDLVHDLMQASDSTAEGGAALRDHLERCESCAQTWHQLEAARQLLSTHAPEMSVHTEARVLRNLRLQTSPEQSHKRRIRWWALAAAAPLGALVAILWAGPSTVPELMPVPSAISSTGDNTRGSTVLSRGEHLDLDGAKVVAKRRSRLRVLGATEGRRGLKLHSGALLATVRPLAPGELAFEIDTPDVRVHVVGTIFRVAVEKRGSEVSVREGTVWIYPRGGRGDEPIAKLRAGQSWRAGRPTKSRRRGPKSDLPEPGSPDPALSLPASPPAPPLAPPPPPTQPDSTATLSSARAATLVAQIRAIRGDLVMLKTLRTRLAATRRTGTKEAIAVADEIARHEADLNSLQWQAAEALASSQPARARAMLEALLRGAPNDAMRAQAEALLAKLRAVGSEAP